MSSLCNRPPYTKGQKAPKEPKPMRKVSAKQAKRKAREKADGAWEHMAAVKALPCVACGRPPPSQAHHVTGDKKPRSDWRVIPLCYECHQGPNGYHAAKRSWVERHGPDYGFLDVVQQMIKNPPQINRDGFTTERK